MLFRSATEDLSLHSNGPSTLPDIIITLQLKFSISISSSLPDTFIASVGVVGASMSASESGPDCLLSIVAHTCVFSDYVGLSRAICVLILPHIASVGVVGVSSSSSGSGLDSFLFMAAHSRFFLILMGLSRAICEFICQVTLTGLNRLPVPVT